MILEIETDDGLSQFDMMLIDPKMNYEKTKKVVLDANGRQCATALLTHDGICLSNGSTAQLYDNSDGNSVDHGDVIQADVNGNVLRNLPSTLGRPQRPIGPIQPEELLEHTLVRAYYLFPMSTAMDLANSLSAGNIYRVAFRPRATVVDYPAYLLSNESRLFLLQCKPIPLEFIRLDQPITCSDELEDDDDLWDDWPTNTNANTIGGNEW